MVEMAVYVRKDDFNRTAEEHKEIFDRIKKVEKSVEGVDRKVWLITSLAGLAWGAILTMGSALFSYFHK